MVHVGLCRREKGSEVRGAGPEIFYRGENPIDTPHDIIHPPLPPIIGGISRFEGVGYPQPGSSL